MIWKRIIIDAQSIQLVALIGRGHRELLICADYIGKNLPTSRNGVVKVSVTECDGSDLVGIYNTL